MPRYVEEPETEFVTEKKRFHYEPIPEAWQASSISAKTGIEIALLPTNQANGSALIWNKAVITLVLGSAQESERRTAQRPFSPLMDVTFP
ncbi:hypothetical protein MHYP_G00208920 [Metynnis hypsauchen]